MPNKRPYTLKLDEELIAAIKAVKARDGIPESEQIRRGLQMWLATKDVRVDKPLTTTRKRRSRP